MYYLKTAYGIYSKAMRSKKFAVVNKSIKQLFKLADEAYEDEDITDRQYRKIANKIESLLDELLELVE